MKTEQLKEYHEKAAEILEMISLSRQKIRLLQDSLMGMSGQVRPNEIRHDIEISQAVIIRLNTRLDRLKFKFDM